jgi:thiol-disulfide isomerase/thioredoxin
LSALSAPSALSAQSAPADFSWRLERADGSPTTLEALRGGVLVINVWASWCVPCVTELPALERLADSLSGTEVTFAAISVDKPAALRRFLVEHPVRLPVYREVEGPPKSFGLSIVPSTYVIDRTGAIVLHHRGAYDWDQAGLRVMLRALTHDHD